MITESVLDFHPSDPKSHDWAETNYFAFFNAEHAVCGHPPRLSGSGLRILGCKAGPRHGGGELEHGLSHPPRTGCHTNLKQDQEQALLPIEQRRTMTPAEAQD